MFAKFRSDRTTDGDVYMLGRIHPDTHKLSLIDIDDFVIVFYQYVYIILFWPCEQINCTAVDHVYLHLPSITCVFSQLSASRVEAARQTQLYRCQDYARVTMACRLTVTYIDPLSYFPVQSLENNYWFHMFCNHSH